MEKKTSYTREEVQEIVATLTAERDALVTLAVNPTATRKIEDAVAAKRAAYAVLRKHGL